MSTPTTARRRGRPRPVETINRDEEVYDLLAASGPLTRNRVAEHLRLPPSIVYLSLVRLRDAGRLRQCVHDAQITWAVNDGAPCP